MMYGFNMFGGGWFIGMSIMILFLVAVILLVIWAVRRQPNRQPQAERDQALGTLQRRYAAGEISAAEYEQARARLEEIPTSSH